MGNIVGLDVGLLTFRCAIVCVCRMTVDVCDGGCVGERVAVCPVMCIDYPNVSNHSGIEVLVSCVSVVENVM